MGKNDEMNNFNSVDELGNLSFYHTQGDDHLIPKAPPPNMPLPPLPTESPHNELYPTMGGETATTKSQADEVKTDTKKKKQERRKSSKKNKVAGMKNSYQQQYAVGSSSIENYGNSTGSGPLIFDLNPVNVGLSNAKDGQIASLNQIVKQVNRMNIALCAISILIQTTSWIGNFFTFAWSRLVLGIYLLFFSILMFCYELHHSFLAKFLRDNFGLLYSTGWRVFCYFIMGTMSIGQDNLIMYVAGFLMIGNSIYTIWISCMYPDFKSVYEKEGKNNNKVERASIRDYIWANAQTSKGFAPAFYGSTQMGRPESESLVDHPI